MTDDPARVTLEAALDGRGEFELFPCDPALADTAAFCAATASTRPTRPTRSS